MDDINSNTPPRPRLSTNHRALHTCSTWWSKDWTDKIKVSGRSSLKLITRKCRTKHIKRPVVQNGCLPVGFRESGPDTCRLDSVTKPRSDVHVPRFWRVSQVFQPSWRDNFGKVKVILSNITQKLAVVGALAVDELFQVWLFGSELCTIETKHLYPLTDMNSLCWDFPSWMFCSAVTLVSCSLSGRTLARLMVWKQTLLPARLH